MKFIILFFSIINFVYFVHSLDNLKLCSDKCTVIYDCFYGNGGVDDSKIHIYPIMEKKQEVFTSCYCEKIEEYKKCINCMYMFNFNKPSKEQIESQCKALKNQEKTTKAPVAKPSIPKANDDKSNTVANPNINQTNTKTVTPTNPNLNDQNKSSNLNKQNNNSTLSDQNNSSNLNKQNNDSTLKGQNDSPNLNMQNNNSNSNSNDQIVQSESNIENKAIEDEPKEENKNVVLYSVLGSVAAVGVIGILVYNQKKNSRPKSMPFYGNSITSQRHFTTLNHTLSRNQSPYLALSGNDDYYPQNSYNYNQPSNEQYEQYEQYLNSTNQYQQPIVTIGTTTTTLATDTTIPAVSTDPVASTVAIVTESNNIQNNDTNEVNYDVRRESMNPVKKQSESSTINQSSVEITQSSQNNAIYICTYPYEPKLNDELELKLNDNIKILEEYEDGWMKAINLTSGKEGVAPDRKSVV